MNFPKLATHKPQQTITDSEFNRLRGKAHLSRKYNGYHVDLYHHEGVLVLGSHGGKTTYQNHIPELVAKLEKFKTGHYAAAELWHEDDSTYALQDALNRKDASKLHIVPYDLVVYNNRDISHLPHSERLKYVEELFELPGVIKPFVKDFDDTVTLDSLKAEAIASSWEGFVLADSTAPHRLNHNGNIGRGALWKIKPTFTEEFIATVKQVDANGLILTLSIKDLNGNNLGTVGSFHKDFPRQVFIGQTPVEISHTGLDPETKRLTFPVVLRHRPLVI